MEADDGVLRALPQVGMSRRSVAGMLFPGLLVACHSSLPVATPVATGFSMVVPGVISTAMPEFALTVSPDGSEIYFDRATEDRTHFSIMVSRLVGQWTNPEVAPFSGTFRDVDPFIPPDGKRLYFSSNRPRAGLSKTSFSTWYVERTKSGWGAPIDPGPPLNSDSSDIFVSVSRAGELYFSSNRDGPVAIYVSSSSGGQWSVPARVDLGLSGAGAGNPMISPDGKVLLVTMRQPGSDVDIMFSCRTASGWSTPRPLPAPVNSARADFAPAIDASGGMLYFTSERPGIVGIQPDSIRPPGDLYRIPLKDAGIDCVT